MRRGIVIHAVFFYVFICLMAVTTKVEGHGRLIVPPSRSSMWRFGFDNPINYNDHELYCGGLSRMIQNGGKCGVCGDAFDEAEPRSNEAGGKYGNGIIVKRYPVNSVIKIVVDITANHKGFFEFKLCKNDNPKRERGQDCFDQNVLKLADGSGEHRYHLPADSKNENFTVHYRLPKHLTCRQCVFQWTYTAGNNWGQCKDGTEGIGCGPQETFRACADIAVGVTDNDSSSFDDYNESNSIDDFGGDSGGDSHHYCNSSVIVVLLISFWLLKFTSTY